MDFKEKENIKKLVAEYFIRQLKEIGNYYCIPTMIIQHPFHNLFIEKYHNFGKFNCKNFKKLLNNIEGNQTSNKIDFEEYVTILINSLIRTFIDNDGKHQVEDMYIIGKRIYDDVCAKIFGEKINEKKNKTIDELTTLEQLFGFVQEEYFENNKNNPQVTYKDFLKSYFINYDEDLNQWAKKNGIKEDEMINFKKNMLSCI